MSQRHPMLDAAAVARLLVDSHPWLSCEDCFEQSDAAAEALVSGRPLPRPLRIHLGACPACLEEVEGLAALLRSEADLVDASARAR